MGKLYLIPVPLGEEAPLETIPQQTIDFAKGIRHFIVEREKTARRFLKTYGLPQPELTLYDMGKHSDELSYTEYLKPCEEGHDVGLLSEAGVPGVADPGGSIVTMAHQKGIEVVPLVGPSSILLALMASGMNGQKFTFHGYLPIDKSDRKKAILDMQHRAKKFGETQIFIETPFRNNQMLKDLLSVCDSKTMLSVSIDLNLPTEQVISQPISKWKSAKVDLHKRLVVFCVGA